MNTTLWFILIVPLAFIAGVVVCAMSIRYGIRLGSGCPTRSNTKEPDTVQGAVESMSRVMASQNSLINRMANAALTNHQEQLNRIAIEADVDKGHPPAKEPEPGDALPRTQPGGLSRGFQFGDDHGNMGMTRGQGVV